MHKSKHAMYVDGLGKEHYALVTAINQLHPGYVTLVYVDEDASERENLKTVYDVPHLSEKNAEPNPALPSYDVHGWKEVDEEHKALPSDHPAFDHPHKLPEFDQDGTRIPIIRPEYEAEIAAHKSTAAELVFETKTYTDGSSATGVAPLPDQSPEQQAAGTPSATDLDTVAAEEAAKEATNIVPIS